MRSALPLWLRAVWLCLSPLGLLFATRIAWEKTVWTWSRGRQTVGFSLMHIHPFFAIVGAVCCYLLMLWLIPSAVYVVRRRQDLSALDKGMIGCTLFVVLAITLPDTFFA
jgi:hypothetical protein